MIVTKIIPDNSEIKIILSNPTPTSPNRYEDDSASIPITENIIIARI